MPSASKPSNPGRGGGEAVISNCMRLSEFAPLNREPLFHLAAPPTYTAAERKLYAPEPLRAEITALAPTLASARRLALLKRRWQLWHARQRQQKRSHLTP